MDKQERQIILEDFVFFDCDWLSKRFQYLEFVRSPKYVTFKAALSLFLQNDGKIIVETGTQRLKDDPGGCSTTLFGAVCKRYNTRLFTVDNNPLNLKVSMDVTKEFKDCITYVLKDSVEYLRTFDERIDLLYLDSLDCPIPPADATASQVHNLKELKAAYDKLHETSIILLDDNNFANGGKTELSKRFLVETGQWQCILDHGQSLWERAREK